MWCGWNSHKPPKFDYRADDDTEEARAYYGPGQRWNGGMKLAASLRVTRWRLLAVVSCQRSAMRLWPDLLFCLGLSSLAERTVTSVSGRSDQGSFAGIFSADPTAVLIVTRPNTEEPRTQHYVRSITRTLPRRQRTGADDQPRRLKRPRPMHYFVAVAGVETRLSSTLPSSVIFLPYVAQSPLRCAAMASS